MNDIKGPQIPERFTVFAKAIAELCDQHALREFRGEITPSWDDKIFTMESHLNGSVKIYYRALDGRGRPSKSLTLTVEATHRMALINEPESSS